MLPSMAHAMRPHPVYPPQRQDDYLPKLLPCLTAASHSCHTHKICAAHSNLSQPDLTGWAVPCRLAFNPPVENVNSPPTSWHHPFDAACLGSDYVRNQMVRGLHQASRAQCSLWARLCSKFKLTGVEVLTTMAMQGSNIDLMQLHMYPDSWLRCDEACKRDWSIRWVRRLCDAATPCRCSMHNCCCTSRRCLCAYQL